MGLCKCPKRRVTNQFCFEHRVNVCEHCMVTNHPKCIVQSYLQWLQDSDYNPFCEICKDKELSKDDCVRLTCYHVFHWWCLDAWARSLPVDTAPAGYSCPTCHSPLFPPANLVSPVADALKEKLAGVNWARTGLGLPLLNEDLGNKSTRTVYQRDVSNPPSHSPPPVSHSIVHMPDTDKVSAAFSRSEAPRRAGPQHVHEYQELSKPAHQQTLFDHDEDKYKRRLPGEWIMRKWRGLGAPGRGRRHWRPLIAILVALGIALIILGMLGRYSIDENDPAFDVNQNPRVKSIDNR